MGRSADGPRARRMEPRAGLLTGLVLWLALLGAGAAAAAEVSFLGESYVPAFRQAKAGGNAIVELVRAGETVESWRRLVAIHHFPAAGSDPKAAAFQLRKTVRQRDPQAPVVIIENSSHKEVIIDFLVGEPQSEVVELNVFKYLQVPGRKGLVAFQFAERLVLGVADPEEVKKTRLAAIEAAANIDVAGLVPLLDGQ